MYYNYIHVNDDIHTALSIIIIIDHSPEWSVCIVCVRSMNDNFVYGFLIIRYQRWGIHDHTIVSMKNLQTFQSITFHFLHFVWGRLPTQKPLQHYLESRIKGWAKCICNGMNVPNPEAIAPKPNHAILLWLKNFREWYMRQRSFFFFFVSFLIVKSLRFTINLNENVICYENDDGN